MCSRILFIRVFVYFIRQNKVIRQITLVVILLNFCNPSEKYFPRSIYVANEKKKFIL